MADYFFIKFDGIKGTSRKKGFEDWVEVEAYSHSVNYTVEPGSDFTGGVFHAPFSITKIVDNTTPKLYQLLNQRKAIKKIEFNMYTDDNTAAAGGKKLIWTVVMDDCRVTNISMSAVDSGSMPSESVSFAYQKITWTYDKTPATHDFLNWSGA